jgi:hypothetical protein
MEIELEGEAPTRVDNSTVTLVEDYPMLIDMQDNAYSKFEFKSFKIEDNKLIPCCFCSDDKSKDTPARDKERMKCTKQQNNFKCGNVSSKNKCGMIVSDITLNELIRSQILLLTPEDKASGFLRLPWLVCKTCFTSKLQLLNVPQYPNLDKRIFYQCTCKALNQRLNVEINQFPEVFNTANYLARLETKLAPKKKAKTDDKGDTIEEESKVIMPDF